MVFGNRKDVSIKVDPLFFDNVFEKERKKMENRIKMNSGINKRLSQTDFTRLIAQKKFKNDFNLFKSSRKNGSAKRKKR